MSVFDFSRMYRGESFEQRFFERMDRQITDKYLPIFGGTTCTTVKEESKTLTVDVLKGIERLLTTPPGVRLEQIEYGMLVHEFVKLVEHYADNVFKPAGQAMGSLFGINVVSSPLIEPEHVGHWLPASAIKPSKNRSKRVWKKLLHGTRKRRKVAQRMTQDVAYLIQGTYGEVLAMPPEMEKRVVKLTM